MTFHENLTLHNYLRHLISGEECFYHSKTLFASFADCLISRIKFLSVRTSQIRAFGWGDTVYVGHAIRNASDNAKLYLDQLMRRWPSFSMHGAQLFNIDFSLVFKKYILVRVLFQKFLFYELVMQYISENKSGNHRIVANSVFIGGYDALLRSCGQVSYRRRYLLAEALLALIFLPFLLPLYWRRKIVDNLPLFENHIICNMSMPQMYECYEDLFHTNPNVVYVSSSEYKPFFTEDQIAQIGLHFLGLTKTAYDDLQINQKRYWRFILIHLFSLRSLGMHLLLFFNNIITARAKCPSGQGNVFLSPEHHDLVKTIRNEFIRAEGSKSVFFSYSPMTVMQFYPEEFYENYDYVCLSGKYYEDELKQNLAAECVYLQTGSYTIHKKGFLQKDRMHRMETLSSFRGHSLSITVLCPGICKPTYHSEVKLMELAKQLAEKTNARIFIRQKPFEPEKQYEGFYEKYVAGNESILLTGMEYELFDFLPVTDLFITTYSTSACEMAMCGANIYFIDYLKQDDRFIFWKPDIAGRLLLKEDEAFGRILAWINDAPDGPIRTEHRQAMDHFVRYISYKFDSFEEYRGNLDEQFNQHVFPAGWKTKFAHNKL